jgi:tryptophan synthase alpha subunit
MVWPSWAEREAMVAMGADGVLVGSDIVSVLP